MLFRTLKRMIEKNHTDGLADKIDIFLQQASSPKASTTR